MNSFLYRIAKVFYENEKSKISDITFVFPNRRAGLFFRKYLAEITNTSIFSPEIITINECFASGTNLLVSDKISNLFLLFELFKKHSTSTESFDSFIGWGEVLLSDFDEVDKYLIDARQLFRNIRELNEIDKEFDFLSPNQRKVIERFWANFIPHSSLKTKKQFLSTWQVLYEIYSDFVNTLKAIGKATEGMISKEVVLNLENQTNTDIWIDKHFVFIGFNALNPSEKKLFEELNKRGKADFYWDYESGFLRDADNPASLFYAENVKFFPSKYQIEIPHSNEKEKIITLTGIPSSIGMTKLVYNLLDNLHPASDKNWMKTSIILPDENLLLPLLYSFPKQIEKINITMGYPLMATPVFGFLKSIADLQKRKKVNSNSCYFYHKNVTDILNHQYIAQLKISDSARILHEITYYNKIYINQNELNSNELLKLIFNDYSDIYNYLSNLIQILQVLITNWKNEEDSSIEMDFLMQSYLTLNRINTLMLENEKYSSDLSIETLAKLIQQVLSTVTIPFVGEPLDGLQVMGVLESRGLDFENLIITSFNEGIFPKKSQQNTFIPYNLRRAFGLPTYEYHDAIVSYNFYRLIHRAKNIHFIYDARTDIQSAEISRFAHQLNFLYGFKIQNNSVNFEISGGESNGITVEKTKEILLKLQNYLSEDENANHLSASAIKSYIDCPLQFYLTKIEKLNQTEEVIETIEENVFGTLFHAAVEDIYKPFCNQILDVETLKTLAKNELNIEKAIRQAFGKVIYKLTDNNKINLEGNDLLVAGVLKKYIKKLLDYDQSQAPFKMLELEKRYYYRLETMYGFINLMGIIDRLDEKNGAIRVLDYKTGSGNLEFKGWEDVFDAENEKRSKYVLQTFFYGMLYKNNSNIKQQITPGIIYLRDIFKSDFRIEMKNNVTKSVIYNYNEYEPDFIESLKACIEQIFDPTIPFTQTKVIKNCEFCAYKTICKR